MCVHERTGLEVRSKSLELSGARNDQLTVRRSIHHKSPRQRRTPPTRLTRSIHPKSTTQGIVHDPATSSIYAVGLSDSDKLSLGERLGGVLTNEGADWG